MERHGAACVLVDAGDGLGIVTDRDLRTRVVAAGAGPDTPLGEVMTVPVVHDRARPARRGGVPRDARPRDPPPRGPRRAPARRRRPRRRRPHGRRAARAVPAAGADHARPRRRGRHRVPRRGCRRWSSRCTTPAPTRVTIQRVIASIHDTLVRRLVELAQEDLGPSPVPFAWIALGSYGRREPFPGSDGDSAIAWDGPDDPEIGDALRAIAERVIAGMSAAGIRPCPEGAVASSPLFARSVDAWERAAEGWLADPDRDRGLTLLSVAVEGTAVTGHAALADRARAGRRALLGARGDAAPPGRSRRSRRRPPTGFLRDLVLERGGRAPGRAGHQGVGRGPGGGPRAVGGPVGGRDRRVDRRAPACGRGRGDARARRRRACWGRRSSSSARCAWSIRSSASAPGWPRTTSSIPSRLTPLTRRSLKDAFRAIGRVQRGVAVGLGVRAR